MTRSIICDRCGSACTFLVFVAYVNAMQPVWWCIECVEEEADS